MINIIIFEEYDLVSISVIIPVYNEKKEYLQRLFESLRAQIYSDYEVIVVDDGSTNSETIELLDNIRLDNFNVFHKKNGGSGSARNFGLKHAKGEFISFLDADDWIDRCFYSSLIDAIHRDNSDIACGVLVSNGKLYEKFSRFRASSISSKLKYINNGSVCSKIFKRELLENISFPENGLYFEDNPVLLKLLLKADSVSFEPSAKYYYFENMQSKSHAPEKEEKRLKDSITILNLIKQWADSYEPKDRDLIMLTVGKFLFMPVVYNEDEYYREQLNLIYGKKLIKRLFEPELNNLEKFCSLKKSKDKLHKYLTICGIKFKL